MPTPRRDVSALRPQASLRDNQPVFIELPRHPQFGESSVDSDRSSSNYDRACAPAGSDFENGRNSRRQV